MKSYKLLLAFTLFLAFAFKMKAQYVHERSDQYTPPEDSLVIQNYITGRTRNLEC